MTTETFPVLPDHFALRQIGEGLRYLVDSRSGDYYELETPQMEALRLSDGTREVAEIATIVDVAPDEVRSFFEEQADEGLVELWPLSGVAREPHFRHSEAPHLSDVLIEVTGRCNLKCAHCFNSDLNTAESIDREMTPEQLQRLIAELDDLNVRRIQISGGEALMRPDLWEVVEAIDDHRLFLDVISTNATLINERTVRRYAERFGRHGALYISMDGLTAETYEVLRGKGIFRPFYNAIELLDEHGCNIFINTMAVRSNLHQMDAMYDFMASHSSIRGWRIGMPKVLGRYEEHHEELEVGFDHVIQIFKGLLERWLEERPPFRLELSDFFRTDCFDSGLEDHRPIDNPCKYALTNLTIKPDGKAVFCASLEIHEPAVLGNVVEEGLAGVWYGSRHREFRSARLADLPECGPCRYSRLCGGGCRSNALLSYDDIKARDPRACVAMQMLEEEILPGLPEEFSEQVRALIDSSISFEAPSGFQRYI